MKLEINIKRFSNNSSVFSVCQTERKENEIFFEN